MVILDRCVSGVNDDIASSSIAWVKSIHMKVRKLCRSRSCEGQKVLKVGKF